MSYDLKLPVWAAIMFLIPIIGGAAWAIIKMYFWQSQANKRMEVLENIIAHWDKRHEQLERALEENIKVVKAEFEIESKRINDRLDRVIEKQIETQTLVKLLVDNKIKG